MRKSLYTSTEELMYTEFFKIEPKMYRGLKTQICKKNAINRSLFSQFCKKRKKSMIKDPRIQKAIGDATKAVQEHIAGQKALKKLMDSMKKNQNE